MKDNSIKSEVGIEVYQNDIYRLVDEYIDTELDGDVENIADNFVSMIFYIADNIQKPSNDDIELLDNLFSIYVRICAKYKVLPTLEVFSFLVGIDRNTFTDWSMVGIGLALHMVAQLKNGSTFVNLSRSTGYITKPAQTPI